MPPEVAKSASSYSLGAQAGCEGSNAVIAQNVCGDALAP